MNYAGRMLIGVLLIVAGILFLLDLGDYLDAGDVIGNWWPLAVIAFGLAALVGPARSLIGGLIVTAIGVLLLVANLDFLPVSAGELVAPLILIGIGAGLIFMRAGFRSSGDPSNSVNSFAVFGGQDIVSRSDRFQGGSLTAMFGGIDLDLRQAQLDPNGATIETFAAFGGIDVIVPRGWRIHASGMPIFAAFENKVDRSADVAVDAPTLSITGIAIFGGVGVKHEPD